MNSANHNRLLRICKFRSCPYFVWADNHFPKCACRQTTILRVSKTEHSCCGVTGKPGDGYSTRGCKFFAWAVGAQITPSSRKTKGYNGLAYSYHYMYQRTKSRPSLLRIRIRRLEFQLQTINSFMISFSLT